MTNVSITALQWWSSLFLSSGQRLLLIPAFRFCLYFLHTLIGLPLGNLTELSRTPEKMTLPIIMKFWMYTPYFSSVPREMIHSIVRHMLTLLDNQSFWTFNTTPFWSKSHRMMNGCLGVEGNPRQSHSESAILVCMHFIQGSNITSGLFSLLQGFPQGLESWHPKIETEAT